MGSLLFAGTPVEQARCLLRPNSIGGVLGEPLLHLAPQIERIVGKPVALKRKKLLRFLSASGVREAEIGGPIDSPLSVAKMPDSSLLPALYFVIHDTSWPYLNSPEFPAGFDSDSTWNGNDLRRWQSDPVAHIFVNRLGDSITTTPFSETVRKGWGTKFARDVLKTDAKGLQLHIELVQPRRPDPASKDPKNDRIAPNPGFTNKQYERLALLYICASVRRGTWLIPAYHSAIDAGIQDAHDDPQNFDLDAFAKQIEILIHRVGEM